MKRRLPGTELDITPVCLGTANYGDTIREEDAVQVLDAYTGSGANFIDTANCYGKWIPGKPDNWSEQILGRWMARRGNRSRIVLSTKGGHPSLDAMDRHRLRRADILADFEESCRGLQTDYIDLYWLHRDDPSIPIGSLVDILEELRKDGKIRYYGFSNCTAERALAALHYADQKGYGGLSALQNRWSLARVNEAQMSDQTLVCMDQAVHDLIAAHRDRLSAVSYTSMGNGVFSQWDRAGEAQLPDTLAKLYVNDLNRRRMAALNQISQARGVSVASLVLAWQVNKDFRAVPICAVSTVPHVDELFAAAELVLSPEEMELLDAGENF